MMVCMVVATSVHAATYYVRTGGSDGHSCSQAQTDNDGGARGSIQAGANCAGNPGDTVIVHAGTYGSYGQNMIPPNVNGNSSNYITLRAASGETVWLNGILDFWDSSAQYWIVDGINLDGGYWPNNCAGKPDDVGCRAVVATINQNVRVQNLEAKNASYYGIAISDNSEFFNVRSHGHGQSPQSLCGGNPNQAGGQCHGFYMHGNGNLFDGVEVYDVYGQGVQMGTGGGDNNIIRNSKLHNIPQGQAIGITYAGQNLIYNNLIYNNSTGIYVFSSNNQRVYNNTIYGNSEGGISLVNGTSSSTITNNIVYNNGTNINNQGSNTLSNNLTITPLFANASGNDFHLTSASPAINQGADLSGTFTTDLEGNHRPVGPAWDIGAYEFGGSPVSAPTFTFNVNPSGVVSGNHTMLSWSAVTNDVSSGCTASMASGADSNWTSTTSGQLIVGGSKNGVNLTSPVTYRMSCTGTGGTTTIDRPVTISSPPLGLVAFYKCDGNVNDSSGNGFNATNTNGTLTNGTPLISGNSCVFNGTNQSLSSPNDAHFRPATFSLTTWLKTSTLPPAGGFCHLMGTQNANVYQLGYQGAGMPFGFINNGPTVQGTTNIVNGLTHLLGLTYDGTQLRLWLDNANINSLNASVALTYAGTEVLSIGGDTGAFCNVTAENMRFHDHALTPTEMAAIFAEQATPPPIGVSMPNMTWTVANAVEGASRCPQGMFNCDLSNNIAYAIGFRGEIRHLGNTITEAFQPACRTNHGGSFGAWTALTGSLGSLGVAIADDTQVHMGDSTLVNMLPIGSGFLTAPGRMIATPYDNTSRTLLADSQRTEWETRVKFGSPLIGGDLLQCRYQRENGAPFDAYGPTSPPDSFATLTITTTMLGHPSSLTQKGGTTR